MCTIPPRGDVEWVTSTIPGPSPSPGSHSATSASAGSRRANAAAASDARAAVSVTTHPASRNARALALEPLRVVLGAQDVDDDPGAAVRR